MGQIKYFSLVLVSIPFYEGTHAFMYTIHHHFVCVFWITVTSCCGEGPLFYYPFIYVSVCKAIILKSKLIVFSSCCKGLFKFKVAV